MKKNLDQEFEKLVAELKEDEQALKMKNFIQHGSVTTYDHCLSVARKSLELARAWRLRVDERALVRAAFLHDFYLYDWHKKGDHLHGYHHPKIASELADLHFHLSKKEKQIIRSHMWPLTLFHAPASKEAAIVCIADKLCSAKETVSGRRK